MSYIYDIDGNGVYIPNDEKGSANAIEYFTVRVNQDFPVESTSTDVSDSETYANVECVLKLPPTYSADGEPCPLVMCAHGTSGWVSSSSYQTQLNRWDALLADGYATYDVNGGMPFDSTSAHEHGQCMGGKRAVEAYYKAYLYIVQNYNVEPMVYVGGLSMGGLSAFNFANNYPEVTRCVGCCYPVTDLYNQAWLNPWYTGTSAGSTKGCIAREFDFDSASTWEGDKVVGYNPATNKHITVDNTDYCLLGMPVKIWHGDADTTVNYQYSVNLINAIRNAGGNAEMRVVHGAGHGESTFSEWTELFNAEVKAYFNRIRRMSATS